VSVRRPYEWRKGTYTYKIVRMDREEVEGAPATWIGVFVYSHEKHENIFVGALRFKGEDLVLSRRLASFIEVYGRRIPVAGIPQVTVTFGNLAVNGEPVVAIYPKRVPDFAEAVATDDQLMITVGKPAENRTKRTLRLIPDANEKP
jgi:hypothetical protein